MFLLLFMDVFGIDKEKNGTEAQEQDFIGEEAMVI